MGMTMLAVAILFLSKIEVSSFEMLMSMNRRPLMTSVPPQKNLALHQYTTILQTKCYPYNGMICPPMPYAPPVDFTRPNLLMNFDNTLANQIHTEITAQHKPEFLQSRRMFNFNNNLNMVLSPLHGKLDGYPASNALNLKLDVSTLSTTKQTQAPVSEPNNAEYSTTTPAVDPLADNFEGSLDEFERKLFAITFNKLALLAPPTRLENGMSFVQSGLFLELALMALATEVQPETRREIDDTLGVHFTEQETTELIDATLSSLPESSEDLKFRWSSRLVLRNHAVSERFRTGVAKALRLKIGQFNGSETPREMTDALNHMVEEDTGGAIHDTFDEDELSDEVRAVLLTTLYLRARWRSAPTLLNGSRLFRDSEGAPRRAARMIRLNDVMMYADLPHWDAEALEIPYSRAGLSLLVLVPRGRSLRRLAGAVASSSLGEVRARLRARRVAATLPLYTLRMTLLLPNKLQALNISRLVEAGAAAGHGCGGELRLSLAVQRIMFWAEAGRNAFKDDGIEWDEAPQTELVVDRPYIFYVRWKNKTLMHGNFVL